MTQEAALHCASDVQGALRLLAELPDLDTIPLRSGGVLTAVFERGATTARPLNIRDLVSDGTSVLEVIDVLTTQRCVFVLAKNSVAGCVHFSDLNHPVVKLPLFVLLEAVERRLFERLKARISFEVIEQVLDPQRCLQIREKMKRLQASRSNLNWAAQLGFGELLFCARKLGAIECDAAAINALSLVRNRVCHAASDELLIEDHTHVRRLAHSIKLARGLLADLHDANYKTASNI